jgi:cytochrome c peroxidase
MLNTGNGANPNIPSGARFSTARVSSFNVLGNPVYNFVFPNADGTTTTVATSDPGCILIPSTNCASVGPITFANKAKFGWFKTPPLWGVSKTAPYFHDNSALTLDEVVEQYRRFFTQSGGITPISDQDKADMIAYMKLLN